MYLKESGSFQRVTATWQLITLEIRITLHMLLQIYYAKTHYCGIASLRISVRMQVLLYLLYLCMWVNLHCSLHLGTILLQRRMLVYNLHEGVVASTVLKEVMII